MRAHLQVRQKLHLNKLPKWNLSPFILRTRYWLPGEIFFFRFPLSPPTSLFYLSYSSVLCSLIYIAFIFLPLFFSRREYLLFSLCIADTHLKARLVVKNRGPFYRDIDDGKCFVRLSRWAHLETTFASFSLFFLFLSLYLPLSRSLFSRSWLGDVKSHERQ